MIILAVVISVLFLETNSEFFDQVKEERAAGAVWHYVGKQGLDPKAKSLPLQCVDPQTGKACGEKYILWKLKK